MDTDRNLLFGVLALQGDLIDAGQFAEACAAWAARKDQSLADLLVERGWIGPEGRQVVELLLRQKLRKHGDARRGLADAATDSPRMQATLAGLRQTTTDPDLNQSLADLPRVGTDTVQYIAPIGPAPGNDGRYTRTTMHARGGIGQVWVARDVQLDREVALKELRPEQASNDVVLRRFVQEAKITGQLDHPGVVPVYELARTTDASSGGRPYYTMRFIRGRTLSDAVADYHRKRVAGTIRPIDLTTLMQAFLGVCNTVAYAHSRGVIHRDLKGQNIVLGDFGEVVLIDWGLAKLVDCPPGAIDDDPLSTGAWNPVGEAGESGLTVAGQALGTPGFMAPEQAAGQIHQIDRRTDVYGLGAILYELLAGRPPFAGTSTSEVLRRVREEPPEPPRRFNPRAPRALEAVCLKALSKDPQARYATATDLADDVRHWLANEPVTAYAEPWTTRGRRWVSRHRTLVTSAAAALLVAAASMAALLVIQSQANRSLAAALDREAEEKSEAGEQARYGEAAVETFSAGVIRDDLLQRPELAPLRRRFAEVPLNYYRARIARFKEQRQRRGEIDPYRVRQVILALGSVASLQALLGNRDDAIAARKEALALHDAYPSIDPPMAAQAAIDLGNLLRLSGVPAEAEATFRDALARFEAMADPDNPFMLSKIALARADLGRFLGETNRPAEARRLLEQARDAQESLAGNRRLYQIRGNLAATCMTLGSLDESELKLEDALRHHRRSLEIFETLVADSPADAWAKGELARALNNTGLALTRVGRPEEGLAALERGRSLREALVASQPLNIEHRSDLARSHYHLALHASLTGAAANAAAAIDRAEELYRGIPPKGPEDIYFQACLLALRAEFVGAGKPAESLTPDERSRRETLASQAMDRLREASAKGYSNRQIFLNSRALKSLSDRPDFQQLVGVSPQR